MPDMCEVLDDILHLGNVEPKQFLEHRRICKDCDAIYFFILGVSAWQAGSARSAAKSEAARLNGLKGGRPKKDA